MEKLAGKGTVCGAGRIYCPMKYFPVVWIEYHRNGNRFLGVWPILRECMSHYFRMPDRIGVGSRIALVVVLLTLFYVRLQPDFANEKHLSHLPMYQHTGEDERMTSASAPEVDLHIRQWPVSEAKWVVQMKSQWRENS